jgi:hypothetical protein
MRALRVRGSELPGILPADAPPNIGIQRCAVGADDTFPAIWLDNVVDRRDRRNWFRDRLMAIGAESARNPSWELRKVRCGVSLALDQAIARDVEADNTAF